MLCTIVQTPVLFPRDIWQREPEPRRRDLLYRGQLNRLWRPRPISVSCQSDWHRHMTSHDMTWVETRKASYWTSRYEWDQPLRAIPARPCDIVTTVGHYEWECPPSLNLIHRTRLPSPYVTMATSALWFGVKPGKIFYLYINKLVKLKSTIKGKNPHLGFCNWYLT